MCCTVISGLSACSIFSHINHKGQDFRKKVTGSKIPFLFSLQSFFFWNIYHSRKNWERYNHKCIQDVYIKHLLLSSDFNRIWIFSTNFGKILKYQISLKSTQWEKSFSVNSRVWYFVACVLARLWVEGFWTRIPSRAKFLYFLKIFHTNSGTYQRVSASFHSGRATEA